MRLENRFIQHVVRLFARGALLIFVAMLIVPVSVGATASQAGVSWDYRLLGPLNSTEDLDAELTIVIRGSGSFDMAQGTITGGGRYTILDTGGSVVGSGTWTAADYVAFTQSEGPGNSPGEGGSLILVASFDGTGAGALSGDHTVVIQCSMWGSETKGPPGYPWPPDFVKVGSYTSPKTGAVMFNLNQ